MKRYYVCTVELTDIGGGDMGYVPSVAECATDLSVITAAERPTWGLALVSTDDHSLLMDDLRNFVLPDYPLDTHMVDLPAGEVASAIRKLESLGTDTAELPFLLTYREFIRAIGRQLQDTFDENTLVVS